MFRGRILQMTVVRTINCYLSHWITNNLYNYLPSFHYSAHYGFQNNVPKLKSTQRPNIISTLFSKYILPPTVKTFSIFCKTKSVPQLWPNGHNICLDMRFNILNPPGSQQESF